jgi:phosphoribosylformimino-5-aminoimidazole carboxamide ribotide isomerase
MRFRPCIDLHNGMVKQIVGGTLSDRPQAQPVTNFETDRSPADFAEIYQRDGLAGGHVIMLGPGNTAAAIAALAAFPGGLHAGGGINPRNAALFLDAGASHVIVTSYFIVNGLIVPERLAEMVSAVGRSRIVIDLSCRKKDDIYWVVSDRWQRFSDVTITSDTLERLAPYCDEFLVHAVDVEGKMAGIDAALVNELAVSSPIPVTYAGGARSLADLDQVAAHGQNRIDATIGSALDIFGGPLKYADVVAWHRGQHDFVNRSDMV